MSQPEIEDLDFDVPATTATPANTNADDPFSAVRVAERRAAHKAKLHEQGIRPVPQVPDSDTTTPVVARGGSPKWFEAWVEQPELALEIDPLTGRFRSRASGKAIATKEIAALWKSLAHPPKGHARPTNDAIAAQMEIWIANQRADLKQRVFTETLAYDPALGDTPMALYLSAVLERGVDLTVPVAVLQHHVWQCKRKALGLPVERHLMSVFVGVTDGGKTTAVDRFLEPIWAFVKAPKDTQALGDVRNVGIFAAICVKFDELAKLEKQNIEAVKNTITAPGWDERVFHTQSDDFFPNNSTLIATSERHVGELILDTAGMRRFYEFQCRHPLDWTIIGKPHDPPGGGRIDPVAMWRSVDPYAATPLLAVLDQVREAQERMRPRDSVESWAETAPELTTTEWLPAGEAVKLYQLSLVGDNAKAFGRKGFFDRIRKLTKLVEVRDTNKGTTYRRRVPIAAPAEGAAIFGAVAGAPTRRDK